MEREEKTDRAKAFKQRLAGPTTLLVNAHITVTALLTFGRQHNAI